MADEIKQAFNAVYTDGPASNPYPPPKDRIRNEIGSVIQAQVDEAKAAAVAASAGNVRMETWSALASVSGTRLGQPADVPKTDTGTHTDPVVGGTVQNQGQYRWSTSPAGWRRIGDFQDTTALAADVADLQAITDDVAVDPTGDLTHAFSDSAGRVLAGVRQSDGLIVSNTGDGLKPIPSPKLLDPLEGIKFNTFGFIGSDLPGSTGNPVYAALKDPSVIFMMVIMGQSLAEGMNNSAAGTDLPFSTTNDRPTQVLMLNTGRYAFDTSDNPYRPTSFVPLIESNSGFGPRETMCFGMAKHLFEFTLFGTSVAPTILTINAAKGGRSLRQLKRGSTYWAAMLQVIRDAEQIARKSGKRLVTVPVWSQGQAEYNQGVSVQEYQDFLRQLLRSFREDVHGITLQREVPPMFIDVPSNSVAPNDPYSSTWPQPYRSYLNKSPLYVPAAIALGNLVSDPDFCVVGTDYQFSRSGLDNTNYGIHLDSHGYFLKGQMFARAMYNKLFGSGWLPTRIMKAEWYDDTHLDIWFSRTIEVVTNGAITPPNSADVLGNYLGLTFWDSSGAAPVITGHSLISDLQRTDAAWVWSNSGDSVTAAKLTAMAKTGLRLTLSAPSTGRQKKLFHATYKDGWYTSSAKTTVCPDGPAKGARSCVRAVEASVSLPTDQWGVNEHLEYDWAIPQVVDLTGEPV